MDVLVPKGVGFGAKKEMLKTKKDKREPIRKQKNVIESRTRDLLRDPGLNKL